MERERINIYFLLVRGLQRAISRSVINLFASVIRSPSEPSVGPEQDYHEKCLDEARMLSKSVTSGQMMKYGEMMSTRTSLRRVDVIGLGVRKKEGDSSE